jgi:predicted nucleic acid-binding Zn ribbon protein
MPTYDFKCNTCNKRLYDVFQSIKEDNPECCGVEMDTVPGCCMASVFPAEGITLTNVEAKPKTFYSTKEMVVYARKNNLELGALL